MRGSIKIKTEICKGCGYCLEACPLQVISMSRRFNKAGYFIVTAEYPEKCIGCAMCAKICPEIAITVYRDDIPEHT